MPVDYKNGKIYKIESLEGNCIYYGSTAQPQLCKRMAQHRANYKRYIHGGQYICSSKVLKYDDAKIYLVEHYACNSKEELHAREGYYIKNFDCVNKQIPGRDKKEYYDDNKEYILKEKKIYYEINKKHITKYQEKYRKDNKNKSDVYQNEYREKNRQLIREKKRQKEICQCGIIINKNRRARHKTTTTHKALLNNPFINFKL